MHQEIDSKLRHVVCPRCSQDKTEHQYTLVRSSIVSCCYCKLSYVTPRVYTEDLELKLQQWAEQDVVDEDRLKQAFDPATIDYYKRFLAKLSPHVTLPGRQLLDVGCSTGQFLIAAKEAGWIEQGLEIGIASTKYAQDELGLNVTQGSLYDYDTKGMHYDVITLIEVIEHLENPVPALSRINQLLENNGLLLVTTPNYDSLFRKLFGQRWWVINCEDEHIVLFNIETLKGILNETGFEIVDWYFQGLDIVGMFKQAIIRISGNSRKQSAKDISTTGYYESRSSLSKVKKMLGKIGLIKIIRSLLRIISRTFTLSWSPTYAWGEQMVVIARKIDDIEI